MRQFRESERDTEELESLARKDRRKRTAEDVSDEGIEKDLDDNDDVENENQIGGNRNKRHVVDRACFYDQIRERPKIGKQNRYFSFYRSPTHDRKQYLSL